MYARLAVEYNLPLRMASQKTLERKWSSRPERPDRGPMGWSFRTTLYTGNWDPIIGMNVEETWIRILSKLQAGSNRDLYPRLHPGRGTESSHKQLADQGGRV